MGSWYIIIWGMISLIHSQTSAEVWAYNRFIVLLLLNKLCGRDTLATSTSHGFLYDCNIWFKWHGGCWWPRPSASIMMRQTLGKYQKGPNMMDDYFHWAQVISLMDKQQIHSTRLLWEVAEVSILYHTSVDKAMMILRVAFGGQISLIEVNFTEYR